MTLRMNVERRFSCVGSPCWSLPGNVPNSLLLLELEQVLFKAKPFITWWVYSHRMENSVLGNALEGVPEESSEEGEKQNDSKIESAENLDGGYFGQNAVCIWSYFYCLNELFIIGIKVMVVGGLFTFKNTFC